MAANNAGGGFYNTSSATAASRRAVLALDADGANLGGGDYFTIEKSGNSGVADILQYSNAAIRFGTNYTNRATIDMTLDTSGNLLVGTTSSTYSQSGRGVIELNGSSNSLIALKHGNSVGGYIYDNGSSFVLEGGTNFPLGINANGTGYTFFSTAGTERARIDSSGNFQLQKNLSVGGATPTTSGTGITFPATQSASSDANTLDDYEEGTWTPTQGAGLTVVGAFSSAGTYTKIGRVVTVYGSVSGATSVTLAVASIICSGLPFSCSSSGLGVSCNANNTVTATNYVGSGGTTLYSNTAITATSIIEFSATYQV
jgi:hypothetical protein